jgi:AcrR family transcriptional regulator
LEEKEVMIIGEATKVFLRRPLDDAKMTEVARAVDLAKGTLDLLFPK